MVLKQLSRYKNNKNNKTALLYFRYIQPITIICNINCLILNDLVFNILANDCDLNIYGFNRINGEYWGKKSEKSVTKMHFTLTIYKKDYITSYITISPIVGNESEIQKIMFIFVKILKLYEK